MSLCRLMVEDFMNNYGRHEKELNNAERYSDSDLEFGIMYASGLKEDGFTQEPFYKYCLHGFVLWANTKIINRLVEDIEKTS